MNLAMRQLQKYRQVTDTVCYEIKLIRAHNPSFSINKANIIILSSWLCILSGTFP